MLEVLQKNHHTDKLILSPPKIPPLRSNKESCLEYKLSSIPIIFFLIKLLSMDLIPEYFPSHVMKYFALLRTTPIFFKSSNVTFPNLLLDTILKADLTPIPGTLNSIL